MSENQERTDKTLETISDIVSAYVSNNAVPTTELPALIDSIAATISKLSASIIFSGLEGRQKPAIPITKSVTADYIISLEDGLKFKSLKRALSSRYGLTPDEYRQKWNLPADYPMVAPNYAKTRSELAKRSGFGRKASATRDGSRRS